MFKKFNVLYLQSLTQLIKFYRAQGNSITRNRNIESVSLNDDFGLVNQRSKYFS